MALVDRPNMKNCWLLKGTTAPWSQQGPSLWLRSHQVGMGSQVKPHRAKKHLRRDKSCSRVEETRSQMGTHWAPKQVVSPLKTNIFGMSGGSTMSQVSFMVHEKLQVPTPAIKKCARRPAWAGYPATLSQTKMCICGFPLVGRVQFSFQKPIEGY